MQKAPIGAFCIIIVLLKLINWLKCSKNMTFCMVIYLGFTVFAVLLSIHYELAQFMHFCSSPYPCLWPLNQCSPNSTCINFLVPSTRVATLQASRQLSWLTSMATLSVFSWQNSSIFPGTVNLSCGQTSHTLGIPAALLTHVYSHSISVLLTALVHLSWYRQLELWPEWVWGRCYRSLV